ncbi:Glycogen debranching enzyme [Hypsibius exemplaris]|uniref:Glycogen debranching enzyme n=1 Tax=Hypsibius exemplaris TaxID=2072580 RepID=A0A1W0WH64_HYPEX|nr:Glycogen debranching enzyme [Hypsibius exemplaris]
MAEKPQETRFLELEKDDFKKETLFRLKKGWILEFRSGATLFGTKYKILTNHPLEHGIGFRRSEFHLVPWQKASGSADESAFFAPVLLRQAGAFEYYYEDEDSKSQLGHGYFVVDPVLQIAKGVDGLPETLPLDSIVLQTVVTKLLGPLPEWDARLRVARETNYNMLHFTPVQELGDSNSGYALSDQLKVSHKIANSMGDLEKEIQRIYQEYNVLSIVDIVLNHTATSSPWLKDQPQATYNMENSPHLRPAFLLDFVLKQFSEEISEGQLADRGIPRIISEASQLDKIKEILWHEKFPAVKLHEFYLADTHLIVEQFRAKCRDYKDYRKESEGIKDLDFEEPKTWERFGATVDLESARVFFHAPVSADGNNPETDPRIEECTIALKHWIEKKNGERYTTVQSHLSAALNGISGSVWYERMQQDGPHYGAVSREHPLVAPYFHTFEQFSTLEAAEAAMKDSHRGRLIMAHNGWVMSFDPLKNFAASDCNVYLRRELIPWCDNVKLRYGDSPHDCPFLWSRMRDYVTQMCSIFHGLRLDNAHSTPIAVAEYMLDAGRTINPDIYVIAELFTGSEGRDNIFVNRLGITSLIREAGNGQDSHDLGRQIHRYGGDPVGALVQLPRARLRACMAHALLYDQTHDNPSMIKKHSLSDVLPTAAAVSMAFCAAGSTRGYDELVPFAVDIVNEKRLYQKFVDKSAGPGELDIKAGILAARQELNRIHNYLANKGYSQIFVDQMDPDTMAITRHNPTDHSSYICVLRNAFSQPGPDVFKNAPPLRPMEVEGTLEGIVMESLLFITGESSYVENPDFITGLSGHYDLYFERGVSFAKSRFVSVDDWTQKAFHKRKINFKYFPPGSVIILKTTIGFQPAMSLSKINGSLQNNLASTKISELSKNFTVADLNRILFRTNAEEQDDGLGGGVYHIDRIPPLPYCGLQSFQTLLEKIRIHNDLGHPLCENLRAGNWMMDYISGRLRYFENTVALADWLDSVFANVKEMPRYLIPQYFDIVITKVFDTVTHESLDRFGPVVSQGSAFTRLLALGTYQFCGIVLSSKLPLLSPNLTPPVPPVVKRLGSELQFSTAVSLSAGHEHFSVGWARNWGRDTFIALRGLLLLTRQFQDARFIILSYAGCLRHGLIPNLLSEGTGARYNARDAVWFWLYSIQQYVALAPDGQNILKDTVSRMYKTDDAEAATPGKFDEPLHATIQEALLKHCQGLNFRERNAGWNLDREMNWEGFNNSIGVDLATGFVYGGNPNNCGTWMDKMGSSEQAGIKGKPATPRDGSAIEIVALCKSAVDWLSEMYRKGAYPTDRVAWKTSAGQEKVLKFDDWSKLIQQSFEPRFYVGPNDGKSEYIRRDLVNKTPIYKDTYGSFTFWADYQFRPNICIAMVVAPEMFNVKNAWSVLEVIQARLVGPLGMRTLDADDWAYDPNYDNNDQSSNPKRAHGYNYHQGPEWVWLMGYFLRAKLIFAKKQTDPHIMKNTSRYVRSVLSKHWSHMQRSDWKGLPELTNLNGAHCTGSCETQAWSMASIFEAVHCLSEILISVWKTAWNLDSDAPLPQSAINRAFPPCNQILKKKVGHPSDIHTNNMDVRVENTEVGKAIAALLHEPQYTGLVRRLYKCWNEIGYPAETLRALETGTIEAVIKPFMDGLSTSVEGEEGQLQQFRDTVEHCFTVVTAISEELRLPEYHMPQNLPLIEQARVMEETTDKLRHRRMERMDSLAKLIEKNASLCQVLQVEPHDIDHNKVPNPEELDQFRRINDALQQERDNRLRRLQELKRDIIPLMADLERQPTSHFERNLLTESEAHFPLSDESLQRVADLKEELFSAKLALTEEFIQVRDKSQAIRQRLKQLDDPASRALEERCRKICPTSLNLLQTELVRLERLKQQNMKAFILEMRVELEGLFNKCFIGKEDRQLFKDFKSDIFNEEVLESHEAECTRLRDYYNQNAHFFNKILRREDVWTKKMEVDKKENDPARFNNRGGQLLRDQQEKAQVEHELKRLDKDLATEIKEWEAQQGVPFFVYGRSYTDFVQEQKDTYEAQKERLKGERKRAKEGGGGGGAGAPMAGKRKMDSQAPQHPGKSSIQKNVSVAGLMQRSPKIQRTGAHL